MSISIRLFVALLCLVPAALARPNLIGDQLQVIGLASQNSAINNGNTGGAISHSANTGNAAQNIVTDAQSIDVLSNIDVLKKPLVIV
ncbi:hypothetical protein BJ165DRAFT_1501268, partial [Panaeolus papilionaceus]